MNSPVEAVTFDAAGTLFAPAEPVGSTYARIGRIHGITADPEAVSSAFSAVFNRTPPPHGDPSSQNGEVSGNEIEIRWWRLLVHTVFREAREGKPPLTDEKFEALFEDLFEWYAAPDAWRLMPDVIELLQFLRNRTRIAVISNFDRRFHAIARGLGLLPFFDSVFLSCEVGASKPDPAIFEVAARRLQLDPSEILHAGDDPGRDWEGARRAGFQVFPFDPETHPISGIRKLFERGH